MHQEIRERYLEPFEEAQREKERQIVSDKNVKIRQQSIAKHHDRWFEFNRVATAGFESGTQARDLRVDLDCRHFALRTHE